jgi:6-pyruvoyltetrahydropterin/6-carboxytetrahydropterin synthase
LKAKFWFTCNELDVNNWVVDFGGLKSLKKLLQVQFDHTLCIAGDDPLLEHFQTLATAGGCDLRIMTDGVGIERFAQYCYITSNTHVRNMTNSRCWVDRVEVWEHENNSACYTNDRRHEQYMSTMEEVLASPPEDKPTENEPPPADGSTHEEPPPRDRTPDNPDNHNWNFGTKWI